MKLFDSQRQIDKRVVLIHRDSSSHIITNNINLMSHSNIIKLFMSATVLCNFFLFPLKWNLILRYIEE